MAGALWRVRFVSGAVGPPPHTPSCMSAASRAQSFAWGVVTGDGGSARWALPACRGAVIGLCNTWTLPSGACAMRWGHGGAAPAHTHPPHERHQPCAPPSGALGGLGLFVLGARATLRLGGLGTRGNGGGVGIGQAAKWGQGRDSDSMAWRGSGMGAADCRAGAVGNCRCRPHHLPHHHR